MIHFLRQIIFVTVIYVATCGGFRLAIPRNSETIFLRLYNGTTMDEYIDYNLDDADILAADIINDKPTMLYIHGYSENLEKNSVKTVIEAYLKRNDHNVIGVDYGTLANESYINMVLNVPLIGASIATALDEMLNSGFDPEKLHIVSHSLGCQIAGHVGRNVDFQIPRITGLDPAGPLFNIFESRLSHSDARFVDIIHTDYGMFGIAIKTGTVDFFPNSGRRVQPGCPPNTVFNSDDDYCSHHRSWEFYAESVINESAFLGVQCSFYSRFKAGKCNNNVQIIMGYGTPKSAKGNVYLLTDTQSPFSLGEKGAGVNNTGKKQ